MMHEENIVIDGNNLCCKATAYEWSLGIGVQIDVFLDRKKVACLRLLCASDQQQYDIIFGITEDQLLEKALSCLLNKKCSTTIESALKWQKDIKTSGFDNISPIYGNLEVCF